MRSLRRQREWGVQLVFSFPSVWVLLSGHILSVTAAPVGRAGTFYILAVTTQPSWELSGWDLAQDQGLQRPVGPQGSVRPSPHSQPSGANGLFRSGEGWIGTKTEGDSAVLLLFQQYTGVRNQQKLASKHRRDQTSRLQSVSVLKANIFPIKTFIRTSWLEEGFLFNVRAPQRSTRASTFICTNLKAYW